MLTLDHIVVTASSLPEGVADIEAALGLPLLPGGQHEAMGTHNRLLSLGPQEYFEVIAVDPAGRDPGQPRWFNLDARASGTALTHWAARCEDIDAALDLAPPGSGTAWDLQRADLRWRMAVPATGQTPFGGLFPCLIEWTGRAHPAPRLADTGVRLNALRLFSPEADALRAALAGLIDDPRIAVIAADTVRMQAVLDTPRGEVTL